MWQRRLGGRGSQPAPQAPGTLQLAAVAAAVVERAQQQRAAVEREATRALRLLCRAQGR